MHGDEVWNDPLYRKKKIYDGLFLQSVDCIVPVSWFTALTMAREFGLPLSKFRLMPNATDRITPPPLDRTLAGKRILAVSRLDAHDGGKNIMKQPLDILRGRGLQVALGIMRNEPLDDGFDTIGHAGVFGGGLGGLGFVLDARIDPVRNLSKRRPGFRAGIFDREPGTGAECQLSGLGVEP